MPASVGVNHPDKMPPMMMTGIIKGMAASLDASAISEYEARFFLNPGGPHT